MTDRELLEFAAKAAGIKGEVEEWFLRREDKEPVIAIGMGRGVWNPLIDDGDALRLAVKLRISEHPVYVWEAPWDNGGNLRDPCAATRRAIVRAAAEIGKAMP